MWRFINESAPKEAYFNVRYVQIISDNGSMSPKSKAMASYHVYMVAIDEFSSCRRWIVKDRRAGIRFLPISRGKR